jgi:hypothetical protein
MEFSDKVIDKFIAIYERQFKELISREEAIEMARRLVSNYAGCLFGRCHRRFIPRNSKGRHPCAS